MDKVVIEDCYSLSTADCVSHGADDVTGGEAAAVIAPVASPAVTKAGGQPFYNIPSSTGVVPVMQVVTLQTGTQRPLQNLSNPLRNIRLIAIQPRNPSKVTIRGNGTTPFPVSIQPKLDSGASRLPVGSFYSRTPTASVTQLRHRLPLSAPAKSGNAKPAVTETPQRTMKPCPSYWREQQRERELKEYGHLSEELHRGLRILLDLTTSLHQKTVWPFTDKVDAVRDGAPDYYRVVTKPVWINGIKDKFRSGEYSTLAEFCDDFRLMLENCYRYNGPGHPITKKGLRLEQCFEQKLALLPASLKEQCSVYKYFESTSSTMTAKQPKEEPPPVDSDAQATTTTTPSTRTLRKQNFSASSAGAAAGPDSFFSHLLDRVRDERQQREKAAREKMLERRRLRREERDRQRCLWADEMMNSAVLEQMRRMWEIPQIGHFLHLSRKALHIGEIAQYELEHMFLMPQASTLLATLMTSLLSSPAQRMKLAEAPAVPYDTWSAKLNARVADWYRSYNRESKNSLKTFEALGLEPTFWMVCGEKNPLDSGKVYHQLSLLKKVWVFKGLCDFVLHGHKTVQEAMAEEEEAGESREVVLGQDTEGFTYYHFPAVSGSDIRVYRHKAWGWESDPIWAPVCRKRMQEEEERAAKERAAREAAELKKAAERAAAKRRVTKAATGGAKRRKAAPAATPTATQQLRQRIGTRVSPRTLQRQTGLTSYADSDQEEEEPEQEEEEESEDEQPEPEVVTKQVARKRVATPRRRSRRARGGRRTARRKLTKITEEPEPRPENEKENDAEEPVKTGMQAGEDHAEEEPMEADESKGQDEQVNGVKEEHDRVSIKQESPQESAESHARSKSESIDSGKTERDDGCEADSRIKAEHKCETEPMDKVKSDESDSDPDRRSFDPFDFELIIASVQELQQWIERMAKDGDDPMPRCMTKLRDRLQALLEEAQPLEADQTAANEKICQFMWRQWDHFHRKESNGSSQNRGADADEETDDGESASGGDSEDDDESDDESGSDDGVQDDGLRHSKRIRKRIVDKMQQFEEQRRSCSPEEAAPAAAAKSVRKGSYNFDPGWDSDTERLAPKKAVFSEEMKNPHYWVGRRVTRAAAAFAGAAEDNGSAGSVESQSPAAPAHQESHNETDHKDQEGTPLAKTNHEVQDQAESQSGEQLISQLRQLRRQQVLLSSNDPKPAGSSASAVQPAPAPAGSFLLPSKDSQTGKTTYVRITGERAVGMLRKIRTNLPVPASPGQQGSPRFAAPIRLAELKNNGTLPGVDRPKPEQPQLQRPILRVRHPITNPAQHSIPRQPHAKIPAPAAAPAPATAPAASTVSIDITPLVNQAAAQGLIVSGEARFLSMDLGDQGTFIVSAQMTPHGPKVLSAVPYSGKTVQSNANHNNSNENVAVPTPPPAPPALPTPAAPAAAPAAARPAAPAAAPPASAPTSPRQTVHQQNNIISPEVLMSIMGPEAAGAKLSILREGLSKVLILVLANGQVKRLTASQVSQIQQAVRNQVISSAASGGSTTTVVAATTS